MKRIQYVLRYITDDVEQNAQISRYMAWTERYLPNSAWQWFPVMETTLFQGEAWRPLLWVEAVNPKDKDDVYGWHMLALSAISDAFASERHKASAAPWALGVIAYVRAAHRGRGIGHELWDRTRLWLQANAPAVQFVVWEPPETHVDGYVRKLGGFHAAPRGAQDRPLAFVPVSPGSTLGTAAQLLVPLSETPDAEMYAEHYEGAPKTDWMARAQTAAQDPNRWTVHDAARLLGIDLKMALDEQARRRAAGETDLVLLDEETMAAILTLTLDGPPDRYFEARAANAEAGMNDDLEPSARHDALAGAMFEASNTGDALPATTGVEPGVRFAFDTGAAPAAMNACVARPCSYVHGAGGHRAA